VENETNSCPSRKFVHQQLIHTSITVNDHMEFGRTSELGDHQQCGIA
jgi:hypothetical protein